MTGLAMLSAAYYRHRAEVLRFALITTCEPVAARRLRTLVEKYWRLADRADKHIKSAQGAQEPARSPPFLGCGPVKCDDVAIGQIAGFQTQQAEAGTAVLAGGGLGAEQR